MSRRCGVLIDLCFFPIYFRVHSVRLNFSRLRRDDLFLTTFAGESLCKAFILEFIFVF